MAASLALIVIAGLLADALLRRLRLPGLVGMLLVGVLALQARGPALCPGLESSLRLSPLAPACASKNLRTLFARGDMRPPLLCFEQRAAAEPIGTLTRIGLYLLDFLVISPLNDALGSLAGKACSMGGATKNTVGGCNLGP